MPAGSGARSKAPWFVLGGIVLAILLLFGVVGGVMLLGGEDPEETVEAWLQTQNCEAEEPYLTGAALEDNLERQEQEKEQEQDEEVSGCDWSDISLEFEILDSETDGDAARVHLEVEETIPGDGESDAPSEFTSDLFVDLVEEGGDWLTEDTAWCVRDDDEYDDCMEDVE